MAIHESGTCPGHGQTRPDYRYDQRAGRQAGKPESACLRLVQDGKNNFGMALQRIEQAEMLV